MVNERSRAIARRMAEAIGARPAIHRWEADHHPGIVIDLLYAEGWPRPGHHVAATVDLSAAAAARGEAGYELILLAGATWDVQQVLGDVAVRVRREIFHAAPGAHLDHGLAPTYEHLAVRHFVAVLPVEPTLRFKPPDIQPSIAFLQLIAVTDAELARVAAVGADRVVAALVESGAALADFSRH